MDVPSMTEFEQLKADFLDLKKLVTQMHEAKVSVEWVRVDVATEILKCSDTTLWRLCKNGEIAYEKRKRSIRYNLESLRAYLLKHRHHPAVVEARIRSIFLA